jgi:dihydropteroate synthase
VWALDHGARIVRVHDVRPAARGVALLEALQEAAA